ncbi:16S rRNA (guanine(527)-N(7))-methyltransferase RsmG [Deinococcus aquiradiocola]|uniref:16S rRNA (guanine(527)-N(7))-methyltransferase RsmG n=1 Tax=Deinococcus aquiradiocola TaxID=393059 RepID=UPI0016664D55|nr:16S rRNA (guanine(527)-N(7))-methyltransferase RsmG [Deinococcus aquiradiocola]
MTPEGRELLRQAAQDLSVDLGERLELFSRFHDLFREASQRTNLTAITDERDIILKHYVDSLSCLLSGELDGPHTVLDLGTGAGFPGMPLAMARPDLQFTLLDATRKKIAFVTQAIGEVPVPNARAVAGRAEALGRDPETRASFDRVVTRAVSALPVLTELCLPLLRVGGVLIAQKGPLRDEELEAGMRAAGVVGGELLRAVPFTLPVLGDPRTLVLIRKTRPTPNRFPRLDGVPAKTPLF